MLQAKQVGGNGYRD